MVADPMTSPENPVLPAAERRARAGSLPLAGLVASVLVVTLELVRASGPLVDTLFTEGGIEAAAQAALLTYTAPGAVAAVVLAAAWVLRRRDDLSVLAASATVLAVLRLLAQGTDGDVRFLVGLAGVAVGLATLTMAVAVLAGRADGGALAAAALAVGAATGVALQLVLDTWDAIWRQTFEGWTLALALVLAVVVLAALTLRDAAARPSRRAGRIWALGPFVALVTVMLGSLPYISSQTGVPALVAAPLAAVGLLVAGALVLDGWPGTGGRGLARTAVTAAALTALVLAVSRLPVDPPARMVLAFLALFGAQIAAVTALSTALDGPTRTRRPRPEGPVRTLGAGTVAAAAAVGLGTVVPILLHQVDYDTPLGFPNHLAWVGAAALLGVAGTRAGSSRRVGAPRVARHLLAMGTALIVALSLALGVASATGPVGGPELARVAGAQPLTVMSWNIHYGVDSDGMLDLEAVADTIERQDPDVVLLQEVARGWMVGGSADIATWLSERLPGNVAYAPAADRQFGNLVISRWPLRNVEVHALPYGAGPQLRSALSATVDTGAGSLAVVSVHLQQKSSNTPTRMLQLRTLLPRLDAIRANGMVVGGDLNAVPGDPEIAMLTDAGFTSAVDEVGDPRANTYPSPDPQSRIDWVLGRGMAFQSTQVLSDEQVSDHLPIVVQLSLRSKRCPMPTPRAGVCGPAAE